MKLVQQVRFLVMELPEKKYFIFVILVLVAITNTVVNAIVKGLPADITEVPSTVIIRYKLLPNTTSGHICGGNIINNRHILTLARCVPDLNDTAEDNYFHRKYFQVVAGENSYNMNTSITYDIEAIYVHPKYTRDNYENVRVDLRILKLKTEIPFGPTQRPIKLASETPRSNSSGKIFGWGFTVPGVQVPSSTLQGLLVKVFDYESCKTMFPMTRFDGDKLCPIGLNNATHCFGDSGGPLIVDGKLAGIIATDTGCIGEVPSSAINVADHKSWIESIVDIEK